MHAVAFLKMHGLGNDFVVLDARAPEHAALRTLTPAAARRLADRRRGIGCDQLIVLEPPRSAGADVFMQIRNPDGSEAGACGNATRCVARLLLEADGVTAVDRSVTIETVSGLLPAHASADGLIAVDMGAPRTSWCQMPLAEPLDTLRLPLAIGALDAPCAVSMGNPHAVFFVPDAEAVDLADLGPEVEHHPLFPQRTNVEVVSRLAPAASGMPRLRMRVWERGAGITEACGSGACAVAVAAIRRGVVTGRSLEVVADGGSLRLDWRETDGHVIMTGPTALAFHGTVAPEMFAAGSGLETDAAEAA